MTQEFFTGTRTVTHPDGAPDAMPGRANPTVLAVAEAAGTSPEVAVEAGHYDVRVQVHELTGRPPSGVWPDSATDGHRCLSPIVEFQPDGGGWRWIADCGPLYHPGGMLTQVRVPGPGSLRLRECVGPAGASVTYSAELDST